MMSKSHKYADQVRAQKELSTKEKLDVINNTISSLVLAGCGANLKFVVLPVIKDGEVMDDYFFVGLVNGHDAIPLCYAPTFKDAVEALDAIATGFLALGYKGGLARIKPE
jgi:hypothetical protein